MEREFQERIEKRIEKREASLWPEPEFRIMFSEGHGKGRNRGALQKMKALKVISPAKEPAHAFHRDLTADLTMAADALSAATHDKSNDLSGVRQKSAKLLKVTEISQPQTEVRRMRTQVSRKSANTDLPVRAGASEDGATYSKVSFKRMPSAVNLTRKQTQISIKTRKPNVDLIFSENMPKKRPTMVARDEEARYKQLEKQLKSLRRKKQQLIVNGKFQSDVPINQDLKSNWRYSSGKMLWHPEVSKAAKQVANKKKANDLLFVRDGDSRE